MHGQAGEEGQVRLLREAQHCPQPRGQGSSSRRPRGQRSIALPHGPFATADQHSGKQERAGIETSPKLTEPCPKLAHPTSKFAESRPKLAVRVPKCYHPNLNPGATDPNAAEPNLKLAEPLP